MVSKYGEVPTLLYVMAIGLPWGCFSMVWNQYAIAQGHPRAQLWAQSANAMAVLASLYPLSHAYGLFGVLAAGVLGQIAAAIMYAVRMRSLFPEEVALGSRLTLVTALAHGAVLFGAHRYHDASFSWALCLIALPLFGVGILIGGVLRPEDFRRTWRAIRSRGQPKP